MDPSKRDSRLKAELSKHSPRSVSIIALLALVPVVAFAFEKSLYAGVVTSINVSLIFTSIYLLVSPTEGGHGTDVAEPTA
ncbi:hypothetical protein ZOD2009_20862 [Haladaptatus paucihalophilus DX253]|uniref:DUF8131 domain-containing protein n=1 Tax=Haladaptatus paucihalophilus DX253 TaxID=797209 RepID=E7QZG3_HALPU|nr:hypothetical protein ZOD2009_20862 [Haladaptatus paucihalophilus DX253]GKZ14515.1 hypothetical protein HAL_23960 [Haladaptatus sp. T7]SHL04847.1 hypothetical protein SAMN05444342_2847 [Haladaptatus paucihalophilus DX253]